MFVGSINYSQTCVKKVESISLPECSKYYLQLNSLVFDREYDNCSTEYQDAQALTKTLCDDSDKSDVCNFNLSEVIQREPRCFQLIRVSVEYTCKGTDQTMKKCISINLVICWYLIKTKNYKQT